jgi:ubiquitin C-terminal hydrolase
MVTNESLIFNVFNWVEIKESKCTKCNISKYNVNTFTTFEIDILGTYNKKHNSITLDDCLRVYEEPKIINYFVINVEIII